jgi:hypothetical protein
MKFIEIDAALDLAKELEYLNNLELNKLGDSMVRCFKILTSLIDPK